MGFKYGNLEGTRKPFHIGTGADEASAQLQADSTTRGFLMPRMTSAQRIAISAPAEGLQVFDTDVKRIFLYADGAWTREEADSIETALTMYVDGTTGNDANDGLAWGTAKQTFGFLMAGESDALPREINAVVTINWRNDVRARSAAGHLVLDGFYGAGSITINGTMTAVETFTATGYNNDREVRGSRNWVSDATKAWTPGQWRRHFVNLGHTYYYPIRDNDATTLWMGFGDDQSGSYAATIYSAPELLSELVTNPGVKYDFGFYNFVSVNNCSIAVTLNKMWIDEYNLYALQFRDSNEVYLQYVASTGPTFSAIRYFMTDQSYFNLKSYTTYGVFQSGGNTGNVAIDSTDGLGWGIYTLGAVDFTLIESWIGNQIFAMDITPGGIITFNREVYIQDCDVGCFLEGGRLVFVTPIATQPQARFDTLRQAVVGMGEVVRQAEFGILGWDVTSEFVFSDTDTGTFAEFTAATLQSRQQMRFSFSDASYLPILNDEYDNATSGLVATRYQTAIDEVAMRSSYFPGGW